MHQPTGRPGKKVPSLLDEGRTSIEKKCFEEDWEKKRKSLFSGCVIQGPMLLQRQIVLPETFVHVLTSARSVVLVERELRTACASVWSYGVDARLLTATVVEQALVDIYGAAPIRQIETSELHALGHKSLVKQNNSLFYFALYWIVLAFSLEVTKYCPKQSKYTLHANDKLCLLYMHLLTETESPLVTLAQIPT